MKRSAVILCAAMLLQASGCRKGDPDEKAPVDDTPVIRSTISEKVEKGCGNYSYHYGKALKTLREAEEYKASERDFYVTEWNDNRNEFLLAGISPSFRKNWFESHHTAEKDFHCMVPIFDEVAAAAKRTLPKYVPRGFIHHDSDEAKLMKEALKAEVGEFDLLTVGMKSKSWSIDHLRNGVPSSRYKQGMVWFKSPKDDDGFCRIAYVNIVQDYAGGESYADSVANYISMEPAGCK